MSWNIKQLEERLLIGSTLVEGSTLTEGEAREVLKGRTVQGHPVTEIRELLNYRAAVQWFMGEVEKSPFVSTNVIKQFHQRLFAGYPGEHGQWKSQPNFTFRSDGTQHHYAKPTDVDARMGRWISEFNSEIPSESPAGRAATLYYDFESVHPFEDGNGRIGRVLIAYWLHWKHRLQLSFFVKDKVEHLLALQEANIGKLDLLVAFFRHRTEKEES